jgi:plastocyanin
MYEFSHMTLRFLPTALVLMAAAACSSDKSTAPTSVTMDVFTIGDTFSPFETSLPVGGTVRFNITPGADSLGHNAIFEKPAPGAPADVNIVLNAVVSRQFNTSGTFRYDCTVHPGMSGEIVVQ